MIFSENRFTLFRIMPYPLLIVGPRLERDGTRSAIALEPDE
jgi:hypothetical protein